MNEKLIELAERCEKATGPSVEINGDIWKELHPNQVKGWCAPNGVPIDGYARRVAPLYTASLDAALTLVPEGWFWRAGRTSVFQAWAGVNRTHPDHCDKNDEFFARREYWEPTWTPVLALCSAALRARAAMNAEER
jgi:hypothetical protein